MLELYKRFYKPFVWISIGVIAFSFVRIIATLMIPKLMANIVDIGIVTNDIDYIIQGSIQMILWSLLNLVSFFFISIFSSRASAGFGKVLRDNLFKSIMKMKLEAVEKFGVSTLITRTTNDAMQLQRLTNMSLRLLVNAPLTIIGAAVMSFITDWRLAIIVMFSVPLLAIAVYQILKKSMPLQRKLQSTIDEINRTALEDISGVQVIRAYNRQNTMRERFNDAATEQKNVQVTAGRLLGLIDPVSHLLINLMIVAVVFAGAQFANMQSLEVGRLLAIIQYATTMLSSLLIMSMAISLAPRGIAAGERILEVIKLADEKKENFDFDLQTKPNNTSVGIEFENVSFRYQGSQKDSLKDMTFTIKPGSTVAIIGPTGSGKTTILNLIEGFYEPTQGSIYINGTNINEMHLNDLRACIGYAPQKAVLLDGTVSENIKYGYPKASDADVLFSASMAEAQGFINDLKHGFKTKLASKGSDLSGGQKQRISLARSLVRPVGLYLFDDSFSALDYATDAKVQANLNEHFRDATKVIVTQRISTAKHADNTIVIDQGKVVGLGSHEDLLVNCPLYKEFASLQESQLEVNYNAS